MLHAQAALQRTTSHGKKKVCNKPNQLLGTIGIVTGKQPFNTEQVATIHDKQLFNPQDTRKPCVTSRSLMHNRPHQLLRIAGILGEKKFSNTEQSHTNGFYSC